MTADARTQSVLRIGRRTAMVLVAVGILAAVHARMARPVLLDQHEGPALAASDLPDARIEINSATAAELTLLPGLGPELAARIVIDRETNGSFASLEDLMRVPRIGEVTIERMRPYVVVEAPPGSSD